VGLVLGGKGYGQQTAPRFHVVAYDFGVKKNILRMLAERGLQGHRGACANVGGQCAQAQARRHLPEQRPR
jgi:carbamoyl-phosphate synthase small subunit